MRRGGTAPSRGDAPPAAAAAPRDIRSEARDLLTSLSAFRDSVADSGGQRMQRWKPGVRRTEFSGAALNLAHYLALRRHDLTSLQNRLSELGLSSLGRSEGRVLPSLDALMATLSRLAEAPPLPYPDLEHHRRSNLSIEQQKIALFGPDPHGPGTRIMATLPAEAAEDDVLVRDLIEAGADCVRINCAHDDARVWKAMVRRVHRARKATGRSCRILMDLAGPKCRIASVSPMPRLRVFPGDTVLLTGDDPGGGSARPAISLTHPQILPQLVVGAGVWINDGKIGARVQRIGRNAGIRVELKIVHTSPKGARIRVGKGINFPDIVVGMPSLTTKDLEDLDFVAAHADMVGLSFVQQRSDVAWLQRELLARRPRLPALPIVIKIETREAVRNLPELIVQGAGSNPLAVMIARGDLAVEMGFAELSEVQEQILWLCEAAHVPVIWATQVLENLVRKGMPSRAETTDAAMAQRAECVMLNKGPWLSEGIRLLDQVLHRMDDHQAKKSARLTPLDLWHEPHRGTLASKSPRSTLDGHISRT